MKHTRILEALRDRLRGLAPQTRLPSVRELMSTYEVSQATVDRALGQLKEDGLIYTRRGEGTFVADPESKLVDARRGSVSLLISDWASSFFDEVIGVFTRRFEAQSFGFKVVRAGNDKNTAQALRRNPCDAFLVMPAAGTMQLSGLSALARLSKPCVLLDTSLPLEGIDTVGTDNSLGGGLAAKHLIELGHRRLAVVAAEPNASANTLMRTKGFCDHAYTLGARNVALIECDTQPGQSAAATAHRAISEALTGGGLDATALFVVSDSGALGATRALYDVGLKVPRDASIVGFDGLPEGAFYQPALTTLAQDLDRWAEVACDLVARRLAGDAGPPECHAVKPKLIVRESTAPIPGRSGSKKKRKADG